MVFRFGEYEIDSGRYELRCKGERVALEPKSLDVLLHLVRERNRLVPKQELLDTVWAGVHVTESTLTRAVSLGRAAIGDSGQEPEGDRDRGGARLPLERARRGDRAGGPRAARSARRTARSRARALGALAAILVLAASIVVEWPRPVGWLLALTGSARPPHEPALPSEPSVVVLPFRDLSPDGGHAYLAEGISEDLASALGRFPALFVIARGSAASYQAGDVPIETIGRELGVRYAVQGSVRAAGDELVVTSQLVDAGTGVQVWADRVETRIDDALAVQARLAEEIVGALGTNIESAEIERLRRLPTDDLGAYELYVRARTDFYAFTRESHARSRELVERALALDPDYPHAVALQAALELAPYLLGWDVDPARLARARAIASRAVALDGSSGLPHTTLALAHMSEGHLEQAVRDARTAVALGPNSDVCLGVQAATLSQAGSYLEALRSLDRAMRLNPRHPELYWLLAGFLQLETGRRDLGVDLIERVRTANPDMVPPRLALAYQYHRDGDPERVSQLGRRDPAHQPRALGRSRARDLPLRDRRTRCAQSARWPRFAPPGCAEPSPRDSSPHATGVPRAPQRFPAIPALPKAAVTPRAAPRRCSRVRRRRAPSQGRFHMQADYLLIASRDPYTHVAPPALLRAGGSARGRGESRDALPGAERRAARASGRRLGRARGARAPRRPRPGRRFLAARTRDRAARARPGVEPASLEVVIEALEHGARALWH